MGQVIVPRYDKDGKEIEGRARVCIDARPINKALVPYRFPIPSIKKIIHDLSKKKFFTEIDLSDSFQQFTISEELSDLLTVTCSFGKVSCTRLTYGVQFATDIFQETMSLELVEFLDKWLMIYVDNFLLSTATKTEHLVALQQLFQRLRKLNIKCRKEKCQFMVDTVRTMGFEVKQGEIRPDSHKIDMLRKTVVPKTKADLKAYLGLLQFYRNMLPHLAHTAHSLYAATSENFTFQWTEKLQQAFDATQDMLKRDILLTNIQGTEAIKVYIDASKYAVCVVVTQNGKIVVCASKVLNPSQRRWATIERELYAGAWGMKTMRFYLHGVFFELFTDHKPLIGLFNKEEAPNNRMMTMLLSTTEYTFKIQYLPGVKNILADYGTRYIDVAEWDKVQDDDQEGLHELFSFEAELPTPLKAILENYKLSEQDKIQLQQIDPNYNNEQNPIEIEIKGRQKIYVPTAARQPLFWYLHKKLHSGASIILKELQTLSLYWPNMSTTIEQYLSQCICATKKNSSPHKYSEVKHILASHPLQILAIDLYNYNDKIYFTAICLYSKYSWVHEVNNKTAATILKTYQHYCATFSEPELISCDNGGEFEMIETPKIPHPSEHPQANGVVERFHKELGKISRIFNEAPDMSYRKLSTAKANLIFYTHLKNLQHDCFNSLISYETRTFQYNDLVWRKIPSRKRAKDEDTFTGPHRVLTRTGKFTYNITSHLNINRTIPINVNDIKILHLPDTRGWQLNPKYVPQLLIDLGSKERTMSPLIDFTAIDALVLDVLEGKETNITFFVIPDWPCAEWYKPLHQQITAEAVRMPDEEDIFIRPGENGAANMGKFAWRHWLFELAKTPHG